METVKQSGLWSGLGVGKLSPQGYYVFSLVDKPGIEVSLQGYYVVSLVDKPSIHEIRTFDHEDKHQSIPQTMGILTKVFCTSGLNLVIPAWTDDELLMVWASSKWGKLGHWN